MDFAAGALEDDPKHPALDAELLEAVAVLILQRGAVERKQGLPAKFRRYDGRAVVRLLGELVRHLEEQQQRSSGLLLAHLLPSGAPARLTQLGPLTR